MNKRTIIFTAGTTTAIALVGIGTLLVKKYRREMDNIKFTFSEVPSPFEKKLYSFKDAMYWKKKKQETSKAKGIDLNDALEKILKEEEKKWH